MNNGYPPRPDYHDPRGGGHFGPHDHENGYMRSRYSPTPDSGFNDRYHPHYESARHYQREPPFQRDNAQYYSARSDHPGYHQNERRRPPPIPRHQPQRENGYYSDDPYRDDVRQSCKNGASRIR